MRAAPSNGGSPVHGAAARQLLMHWHTLSPLCRLPEEEIEEKLAAYRTELLAKLAAAQPSKEKCVAQVARQGWMRCLTRLRDSDSGWCFSSRLSQL